MEPIVAEGRRPLAGQEDGIKGLWSAGVEELQAASGARAGLRKGRLGERCCQVEPAGVVHKNDLETLAPGLAVWGRGGPSAAAAGRISPLHEEAPAEGLGAGEGY